MVLRTADGQYVNEIQMEIPTFQVAFRSKINEQKEKKVTYSPSQRLFGARRKEKAGKRIRWEMIHSMLPLRGYQPRTILSRQ